MYDFLSSLISSLSRPPAAKFARVRRLNPCTASRSRGFSHLKAAVGMALLVFLPFHAAQASSRLKDIVNFEGVRDNMLVGYGLVVGLNGTGDSLTNAPFTERSLIVGIRKPFEKVPVAE